MSDFKFLQGLILNSIMHVSTCALFKIWLQSLLDVRLNICMSTNWNYYYSFSLEIKIWYSICSSFPMLQHIHQSLLKTNVNSNLVGYSLNERVLPQVMSRDLDCRLNDSFWFKLLMLVNVFCGMIHRSCQSSGMWFTPTLVPAHQYNKFQISFQNLCC
jgi:hypothetical protein